MFKPGDYVCLHTHKLVKQHIPCRVVGLSGESYRLFSKMGVICGFHSGKYLTVCDRVYFIPLIEWRQSSVVKVCDVQSDSSCVESCNCTLSESSVPVTVISDDSDDDLVPTVSGMWLQTPLYKLTNKERELINPPNGWLNDSIIFAAQLLILQQFPNMSGLQPTTLAQTMSFEVHRARQILHVENCQWCIVSSVGCDDGVVNVCDSMFSSVFTDTVRVIASLVFSSVPKLVIQNHPMDVGLQSNGSDCGVLAIAFAYDICSGNDPCKAKYDYSLIRQHLLRCLEDCNISRFPLISMRRHSKVKHTKEVELHCCCHMPEMESDEMAQCDSCNVWYHRHCMDIPDKVFGESEVPWICKDCSNQR